MNFADICCGINKLKIKQNVLEKNELDFIKIIKSNYGISLDDEYCIYNMTRAEVFSELQKDIIDNLSSLKKIKSTITRENLEKIDLLTLKNTVLSQENDTELLKFRVNTELDNLLKQENDLNLDLINFEMKIEDAVNNKLGMISSVRNAIEYKFEHQEIKDFATFVNTTGGHEGGWTYNDHLVFIRNYNKIKNIKKLVRVLHNILPDIAEEQILSHISWYKKYLDLRYKQKQVLEKWRKNKNKKPHNCENEQDSENKSYKTLSNNYTTEEDETTMRAKLTKWKEEKQEKLQKERQNMEREHLKNKLIQKNKELQNLTVKKQVNTWKNLKTVQEKANKLEKDIQSLKQKEKKIAVANKLIRDFQSQDNIYLIRRINNLRLKKRSNVGKPAPPQPNKKRGQRDPQRIYKSTKQWISRVNADNRDIDERVYFGTVTLKDIPKLGIPTWRTSMNM